MYQTFCKLKNRGERGAGSCVNKGYPMIPGPRTSNQIFVNAVQTLQSQRAEDSVTVWTGEGQGGDRGSNLRGA